MARDPEIHVHRIGRTGRAGSHGLAFTLFIEKEMYNVGILEEYLNIKIQADALPSMSTLDEPVYYANMVTLQLDGGKKQKIRPGDILGALTGDNGISGSEVGKINMYDNWAYVAVHHDAAKTALKKISEGKMKGRSIRVRRLRG
jgi:ATP-independent RNA helicase DbpA